MEKGVEGGGVCWEKRLGGGEAASEVGRKGEKEREAQKANITFRQRYTGKTNYSSLHARGQTKEEHRQHDEEAKPQYKHQR